MSDDLNLSQNEGQREEWKESFAQFRSSLKTICAFINTEGGRLFVGVNNDGAVVGVEGVNFDVQQKKYVDELSNSFSPRAVAFVSFQIIRHCLIIDVRPDPDKMYCYNKTVYVRRGSSTVSLSYEEARALSAHNGLSKAKVYSGIAGPVHQYHGSGYRYTCPKGHGFGPVGSQINIISMGGPPPTRVLKCPICFVEFESI